VSSTVLFQESSPEGRRTFQINKRKECPEWNYYPLTPAGKSPKNGLPLGRPLIPWKLKRILLETKSVNSLYKDHNPIPVLGTK